jgi:hypothetical protein
MEGKLFVEPAKTWGGSLWRNNKIDNKPEAIPGYCFGKFVERANGRMGSIDDEVVPTAWCDSLLLMKIVTKVDCRLAPSFFWG